MDLAFVTDFDSQHLPSDIQVKGEILIDLYFAEGGRRYLYTGGEAWTYVREEKHFNLHSPKLVTCLYFFQIW